VLNVTEIRSDAILFTKAQVASIALSNVTYAAMDEYFGINSVPDDNAVKRESLEWLWKGVVQPILRELGFYPTPKEMDPRATGIVDPLPRIWWIGVGLMAKDRFMQLRSLKTGAFR